MKENHAVHWSYSGSTGPQGWATLDPAYASCKLGQAQSPINIDNKVTRQLSMTEKFQPFHYKDSQLKLVNNGHTLQIPYDQGSLLTFAGKQYELVQFHFHTPAEHHFDGSAFPMEAHLVHQAVEHTQQLMVVGVMLREGEENPFLAEFWGRIPVMEGEVKVAEATINVTALLPANLDFYNYTGSLTTPPCTEGVNWVVLKNPVEASKNQLNKFVAIFGHNARPVQPLNRRVVTEVTVKRD